MAQVVVHQLSRATHFELPLISSRFQYECPSNSAALVNECNKHIMQLYNIHDPDSIERFVQYELGLVACLFIPRFNDDRKMVLTCKFLVSLFTFDDVIEHNKDVDHSKDLISKLFFQGEFSVESFHYPPQFRLIREVIAGYRELMSCKQFSRFTASLSSIFEYSLEEVVNYHQANCIPDANTYRRIRRNTIGIHCVCGIVAEFCMGIELEEEDYECEEYKSFMDALSDHCVYVNDLFSFRKEFYKQEYFNWVCVLINEGFTLQESVYRLCRMIDECDAELVKLQNKMIERANAKGSNELLKFADASPLAAPGNIRWSSLTSRYHGFNNPLITGETFYGTCLLHPKATIVLKFERAA